MQGGAGAISTAQSSKLQDLGRLLLAISEHLGLGAAAFPKDSMSLIGPQMTREA